jgi:nicotinamide phosphoribosyltransferase
MSLGESSFDVGFQAGFEEGSRLHRNNNIIFQTDSYKLNHWNQYPKGTEYVYSYFESRVGALYYNTVPFGLQALLKKNLVGQQVTSGKIENAAALCRAHFGDEKYFNRKGWEHILNVHQGKLPIRIKAVSEGMPVPVSNVLMTVENTDPECFWLTNALESLLTHVWYPSTVASLSRYTKGLLKLYLERTSDNMGGLDFMLHDFGYRGVSSDESAEFGGAAHLVNFKGTDTIPALEFIRKYYNGSHEYKDIAYSVAATEHSVMTALGPQGEEQVVSNLLDEYPKGILSVVADSYNIYNFVESIIGNKFRDRILSRDGIFVVRPDSITPEHPTPEAEMLWIANMLWDKFGGITNSKEMRVINPKIRMLWGDGIDVKGIEKILLALLDGGFSAENVATFGMGGGLLQKVNRDTQRFAFKSSAQCRDGVWHEIYKSPKDQSKASKRGKLKLIELGNGLDNSLMTVGLDDPWYSTYPDEMVTVFENGKLLVDQSFDEIRSRAKV